MRTSLCIHLALVALLFAGFKTTHLVVRQRYAQELVFPALQVQPQVKPIRTQTVSAPSPTVAKLTIGARSVAKESLEAAPQPLKLDTSGRVALPSSAPSVTLAPQVTVGSFSGPPAGSASSNTGGVISQGGFGSPTAGSGRGATASVKLAAFERQSSAPAVIPVAVHESLQLPVIISEANPIFTDEARAARISGTVVLRVRFVADGSVKVLGVLQGLGYGLDESAIRTAESIAFTPAMQGGHPVAFDTTARFTFQMP